MHDIGGHVFYVLIFIGTNLIAKKNNVGWLLRLLGELGWTLIGVYMEMTSIWVWGIIFTFNDAYGYVKWNRGGNRSENI